MKKIILILLLTLISCNEYSNIEIIPDYDEEYLSISKVDTKVEILGDEDRQVAQILEIVSKNYDRMDSLGYYFFRSKIYVNENGIAEKIFFKKEFPKEYLSKGIINYKTEALFKNLSSFISSQKFSPAIKNGKQVKSQFEWEGSFRVTTDNKAEVLLFGLNIPGLKKFSNFDSNIYKSKVEEMPVPIGGMKAIAENVKYPKEAKKQGIEGRVYVKTFIDENGNVVKTEIIKGIGHGCDEAAIKAIESVKFVPGRVNSKPVKVQVSIPIMFKLS